MSDEPEYGLVMPFVTVTSKGGPHDDESYCAGYAMGLLDARLGSGGEQPVESVRESCVAQADLLALKHGYTIQAESSGVDGWIYVTFTRLDPSAEEAP